MYVHTHVHVLNVCMLLARFSASSMLIWVQTCSESSKPDGDCFQIAAALNRNYWMVLGDEPAKKTSVKIGNLWQNTTHNQTQTHNAIHAWNIKRFNSIL